MDETYVARATAVVTASPAEVFALLADPRRHQDIDGSGTVRDVQATDDPLRLGAVFDMHMRHGYAYSTRNTVIGFEPERLLAWTTTPLTRPLSWLIGGRIWRWKLEPEGDGTRLTATRDLRSERKRALVLRLASNADTVQAMTTTIQRIGELAAG